MTNRTAYGSAAARWLALPAMLAAMACSSSSDDEEAKTKKIERVPTGGVFAPDSLEDTVDALVDELEQTEEQEFLISVVPKGLDAFFEPITIGANRAIAELGLTGLVEAPSSTEDAEEDERQQRKLLKGRLDDGYQGIGVAPFGDTVAETIDAFVDAGATVVTFDADLPETQRQLYIGTNNAEAGKTGGETLVSLITETEGTVIVLGHKGWPSGEERTMGAINVLEDAGYVVEYYEMGWAETEVATAEEEVPALIEAADPPLVGMMGVFNNSFRAAEQAQIAGFEAGDIPIVAFDFEPETLDLMDAGYIQATHAQRQYYQGYMVPYAIYAIHTLGLKKTKNILGDGMISNDEFDTGMDVVMADQLDDFNAFLDSLGIGG